MNHIRDFFLRHVHRYLVCSSGSRESSHGVGWGQNVSIVSACSILSLPLDAEDIDADEDVDLEDEDDIDDEAGNQRMMMMMMMMMLMTMVTL